MARPSPPLLFLGSVCALWIGARVVVETWGGGVPEPDEARLATAGEVAVVEAGGEETIGPTVKSASNGAAERAHGVAPTLMHRPSRPVWSIVPPGGYQVVAALPVPPTPSVAIKPAEGARTFDPAFSISALSVQPAPPRADRWTLSGWVFVRPMSARTTLGQGLLGGSQAGVRAAWRFDHDGRAEVYARVVSSGRLGDGVEGAAGLSVQPVRGMPMRLSFERREQLVGSGGRSAFAVFASGGVSEVALPLRFRLDGYAAAGVVGAARRDLFAEGSATVRRRLVSVGPVEFDAGVGAWGAVQPDLERVDVGPSVSARWRIGALRPRLSIDWRQNVVGDAAPDSGVAVTLAADF